jgi:TIR domain
MTKPAAARIFISYSRKDGAALAARLRSDLEVKGFVIWQDLVALEGGRDWWSQIDGALKSKPLQHFILVATPHAPGQRGGAARDPVGAAGGQDFPAGQGPGLGDLKRCRAGSGSSPTSTSPKIGLPCGASWRTRAGPGACR